MNTVEIKEYIRFRKRQIKHLENAREIRTEKLYTIDQRYIRNEIKKEGWLRRRTRIINSITNLDIRIAEIQEIITDYENLAA